MIVCHCAVVSDADVVAEVAAGCSTLREVCGATGAGRECGGCVPTVRALLVSFDASACGTRRVAACKDRATVQPTP